MAIITVLAAIAIPTFGRQLETARETNDLQALRAAATDAYTEVYAKYAADGKITADTNDSATISVTFTQQAKGFQYINPVITVGAGTVKLAPVTTGTGASATTADYFPNNYAVGTTTATMDVKFTFAEDETNFGLKLASIQLGTGTAKSAET